MIGSLRGCLLERTAGGEVLVEVGGVGYRAVVPPATAATLGPPGGEVFLHTHLRVREDDLTLYAFATRDERSCFEAMLGAHGVGPAMALAILSIHRPDALARVLADDDVDALCLVPGVGRKTATRLLLELKARLGGGDIDLDVLLDGMGGGDAGGGSGSTGPTPRSEVRAALAALGYAPDQVRAAMVDLPADGDVAALLRSALGALAPR